MAHSSKCTIPECSGSVSDLNKYHGTPESFVMTLVDAIPVISIEEALAATIEYTQEYLFAMIRERGTKVIVEKLIAELEKRLTSSETKAPTGDDG